jgi:hypothetical protein
MTRIPIARDAPSVDCLGMGWARGLVHLATSASGPNAALTEHQWVVVDRT